MKKIIAITLFYFASCDFIIAQSPYQLHQCHALAMQNHASIRIASNQVKSSEEQKKEAFTKYFPQISAVGGWFNSNKNMMAMELTPSEIIPSDIVNTLSTTLPSEALSSLASPTTFSFMKNGIIAGVSAIQPLYAGGQITNSNKLAKLNIEVNQLQKQQAEQQVILTTEQYYWQLVCLKEKMNTILAVEKMLSKVEEDVSLAVKAGITQRNDLLQIQLKQNETASTKIQLTNGIRLSKMALAQHIGIPYTEAFDIADEDILSATLEAPISWHISHQEALPSTSEYNLLLANVEAKQLNKKLEIGKNMPTVAVGVGYNYYDMLDTHRNFGMIFATVSVPISNWWGGSHAIRRQQYNIEMAKAESHNTNDLLVINMQKLYDELDNAWQQTRIASKSIEQATENLRLNQDYYYAGTTTMSDLLEAQVLFQQANDTYSDAYAKYQVAKCKYLIATGRYTTMLSSK